MGTGKARENRLRRMAGRRGLTLRKSRTRDPLALAYGWQVLRGRRELVRLPDIGQVEAWLSGERRSQEEARA